MIQARMMKYSLLSCPATIEGTLKTPAPNMVPIIKEQRSNVFKDLLGLDILLFSEEFIISY